MNKLAIKGGTPVRKKPFPSWPIFDENEERAVLEVLRSKKWGIGGSKNEEFAKAFASWCGVKYAVTCSTGTAALEIALKAIGVGYGDEVIVPAYTFIATASSVMFVNAVPVFADIEEETYNIDPKDVERKITKKTKAIIPVHISGGPANMDEIMRIAKDHNLYVIEDAAQAHGAEWKNKKVGSIGHIGAFSFQSSKNITSGEGGIVTTNDEELANKAWSYMNVGRIKGGEWYEHFVLGKNYRLTEFQAAILIEQLKRAPKLMEIREKNAQRLKRGLHEIGGVEPLKYPSEVTRHAYHLFIIRYNPKEFNGLNKEMFVKALQAEGIPASSGYIPLYREQAIINFKLPGVNVDYSKVKLPITEKACYEEGVWLPQNVLLGNEDDIEDILKAIKKIKENSEEIVK